MVSVLFVDLVGFTTLSEHADPETVRELQTEYFELARTVVDRYGGVTEKFIGDAVVAVWGTPVAREDDPERAVRAGLDLLDAVAGLGQGRGLATLQARAGVGTGQAAVRLDAVDQGMVTGDVVNSAARIQSIADPGQVWVDDATREASSRAITYAGVGDHDLKGRAEPVRLFSAGQVVAGSGGAQRVDGLEAPFLGRDRDLRVVKELFHDAVEQSRPRLVVVSGVAGVGKSRLGWEFFKYLDGIALLCSWHVGRCRSFGEGTSYGALAEMVRMRLRIGDEDPDSVAVGKLDAGLDEHVPDAEERTWLRPRLAVLLGLPDAVDATAADLGRESLFAGWRRFVERLAEEDPVVLLFEDLQYADADLLDFVDHLLEWSADQPIFVLALARPELLDQRPGWGVNRNVTTLTLDALGLDAMEQVVGALVAGLSPDTRRALAARAEGLPLFAIETVRMLIDRDLVVPRGGEYVLARDVGDVDELEVPPTLQALVAARLDNLPDPERRLVKDAAVLGMSFSPRALVAVAGQVSGTDPQQVEALLSSLVRREVLTVHADARSPEAGRYRFEQKVMRSVAYETLSRRDRRARHLAVAQHLLAGDDHAEVASVVASHYLSAVDAVPDADDADDLRAAAVDHLERAGDRARMLAAPEEAMRAYEQALALVDDDEDRRRLAELAGTMARRAGDIERALVLLGEAHALLEASGHHRDVARVAALEGDALIDLDRFDEAQALMSVAHAQAHSDRPDAETAALASVIAITHLALGDADAADRWIEEAIATAEPAAAWSILGRALNIKGLRFMNSDRYVEGRGLLGASLDLAREHGQGDRIVTQSANLAVMEMGRDLERAEHLAREALAEVPRLGDRRLEAFATGVAAHVDLCRGRWDAIDVSELRRLANLGASMGHGLLVPLAALAAWRGMPELLDGFEETMHQSFDDLQVQSGMAVTRALAATAFGDTAGALAEGEAAVQMATTFGFYEEFELVLPSAVGAAIQLSELDRARSMLDIVATRPPGLVSPLQRGLKQWLEGQLAARRGHDDAGEHFEEAIIVLSGLGARFWLARAQADHARWLTGQGETVRAADLAARATATFTELGAAPFLAELEDLGSASHAEASTLAT